MVCDHGSLCKIPRLLISMTNVLYICVLYIGSMYNIYIQYMYNVAENTQHCKVFVCMMNGIASIEFKKELHESQTESFYPALDVYVPCKTYSAVILYS